MCVAQELRSGSDGWGGVSESAIGLMCEVVLVVNLIEFALEKERRRWLHLQVIIIMGIRSEYNERWTIPIWM